MNEGLKQRIIGAVVLICLGLILWPVLFSEPNGPAMNRQSQIPPPPEFQKYRLVEAQQPTNLKPVGEYTPQPEEALEQIAKAAELADSANTNTPPATVKAVEQAEVETTAAPKQPAKTVHSELGLPVYWALQVASFRDSDKAKQLKAELIKQGYKVDTRKVQTSSGQTIRVYVGPKLDKALLEKDQAKIDSSFKVKSMLVRFSQ